MKYGVHLPNFGPFGDARVLADLAVTAEDAGWDGFFLWDHILFCDLDKNAHVDPWIALTAVAGATEQIMIGSVVTPLPRRRPWELARQAVSVQNFSRGRLILGVGLGEPTEWDFRSFGEPIELRTRAEMLDESLRILIGLWTGEEFHFRGQHYSLEPVTFLPPPVTPIPVWVGGRVGNVRALERAALRDGMVPMLGDDPLSRLAAAVAYTKARRDTTSPFDVVISGRSEPGDTGSSSVRPYQSLATWWLEDISPLRFGVDWPALADPWDTDALIARISAGPPR